MKAVMVMFDTLTRKYLPTYGGDVISPNFSRAEEKCIVFNSCYAGSLPCMPARRELFTGRYNFLHCPWGPLELFDDAMPEILKNNGIYSHIVTDHYHYWEDGGANFLTKFQTAECIRGQEGDNWKGYVSPIEAKPNEQLGDEGMLQKQDRANRDYIGGIEKSYPQTNTFDLGIEFIDRNHDTDNWYLQIETFDPHEPFDVPETFKELYPDNWAGPRFDWPPYSPLSDKHTPEAVSHAINLYKALMTYCDKQLGRVLDAFDKYDLWKDTMLIINTDHGTMMGEKDYWMKMYMPFFEEHAHTPLFIYDPRAKDTHGRRDALVQTIDIPATILEFFNIRLPKDMTGMPLKDVIAKDKPHRDSALYGLFGGPLQITDGRYSLILNSNTSVQLFRYTLEPANMRHTMKPNALSGVTLSSPLSFTKGAPVLKIPMDEPKNILTSSVKSLKTDGYLLYDLKTDPDQTKPIHDKKVLERLKELAKKHFMENSAPDEMYERFNFTI